MCKSFLTRLILMGCLSAIVQSKILPLPISNSTKEEILEGVELFIGGSFTAIASSWVTTLLSFRLLALNEAMIKFITGGIAPIIFVLLTHLLHRMANKAKGHDHSDDNENIEKGTGANFSGGVNAQTQGSSIFGGVNAQSQGGCCPGCSVAYCQALRQRKRKKNAPRSESEEFLMRPEDERFFKESIGEQKTEPQPWECAFGMCSEISPSSNEGPIFPVLDTVGKAKSGTKTRVHRFKPKQQSINTQSINTQNDQVSSPLSAEKVSAAVAEDIAIMETLYGGNSVV